MPIPARLSSLYRLTLRVLAASVLHQPGAKRSLRALYRPVFDEAAKVAAQLEAAGPSDEMKEAWWKEWEERMDNTLQLHLHSALHPTLPHRLTKNLAMLRTSVYSPYIGPRAPSQWDPSQGKSVNRSSLTGKFAKRRAEVECVDRALDEVWQAAEGSARVMLGRIDTQKLDAKQLRKVYKVTED